ncbi:MAG: DUF2314 domain-containing protein [Pseudomonadota bacterium]
MSRALTAVLVVLALVPTPGWAGDPVVDYEDTDPEMNAAIDQARATLPHFFEQLYNRVDELEYFGVKVAVPTTSRPGLEHIWVGPFRPKGDGFEGYVANEPNHIEGLAFGDLLDFTRDQITDWSYVVEGRRHGAYTLRVMLPQIPQAQAAEIKATLAPLP